MHRSTERILTTHCGSLPRPRELLAPLHAKDSRLPHDRGALAAGVRRSVADVVRRQVETGIDVVNNGEHSKSSFAHYARTRIGGLTVSDEPRLRLADTSRDALGRSHNIGQADLKADIDNLKAALRHAPAAEAFIPGRNLP